MGKKVFYQLLLSCQITIILGNCNLANVNNHVGAVGFLPPLLTNIVPMGLIKVNQDTGEPLRDGSGQCIRFIIDQLFDSNSI